MKWMDCKLEQGSQGVKSKCINSFLVNILSAIPFFLMCCLNIGSLKTYLPAVVRGKIWYGQFLLVWLVYLAVPKIASLRLTEHSML